MLLWDPAQSISNWENTLVVWPAGCQCLILETVSNLHSQWKLFLTLRWWNSIRLLVGELRWLRLFRSVAVSTPCWWRTAADLQDLPRKTGISIGFHWACRNTKINFSRRLFQVSLLGTPHGSEVNLHWQRERRFHEKSWQKLCTDIRSLANDDWPPFFEQCTGKNLRIDHQFCHGIVFGTDCILPF